jgi:hypothetical protein
MDKNSYKKIIKYLNRHQSMIDETFKIMIIDLLTETNFDYYTFKEILNGAYIIIEDSGYFYKKWILYHKNTIKKQNKIIEPIFNNFLFFLNTSSHNSCSNQYRLGNGVIYNINDEITNIYDFLIGTTCQPKHLVCKKNKKCNTWFQLERSRLTNFINIIGHSFDFINYYINGNNIGPFGESEHTELKNPIIIKLKKAL